MHGAYLVSKRLKFKCGYFNKHELSCYGLFVEWYMLEIGIFGMG